MGNERKRPAVLLILLGVSFGLNVALFIRARRKRQPRQDVPALAPPPIVAPSPRRDASRSTRKDRAPKGRPRRGLLPIAAAAAVVVGVAVLLTVRGLYGAKPGDMIHLATFYHPPEDGTPLQTVSTRFGVALLTRGDESYRDQMRSAGFRGPVLQYLMANETSGPGGLRDSRDACGQYVYYPNNVSGIALDFCSALHGDEASFLHNGRGERLYSTQSWEEDTGTKTAYLYVMNPAAPVWRSYAARRARENLQTMGYSGLFLDNVDLSLYRALEQSENSDGVVREYEREEAYQDALLGYLAELRAELRDATIWANLTNSYDPPKDWSPYLVHLDGAMNEYFVAWWDNGFASPSVWSAHLRNAETALSMGKSVIAVAQGRRGDDERMRYALASYLLIAREGAYFRYADTTNGYSDVWLYDEYQARLGPPSGERYLTDGLWRRDFRCGSVTVDVERHQGRIETNRRHPLCW